MRVSSHLFGGGEGGEPAGSAGQVQYNDAGAFGGAAALEIDASGNAVMVASTPTTPAAGRVSEYGVTLAPGRVVPAFKSASGAALPFSAHLGVARRMEWSPTFDSTTISVFGGTATTAGTLTAAAPAAGSFFSWSRRLGLVSAASAGASAAIRQNKAPYGLGDVAGAGGFTLVARFGVADAAAVANARMFAGLYGTVLAIANVEPTSLTDIIGVGCDAGVTTLHVMHNDGSGTATTVDLGANFPTDTQSTDVYEMVLYAPPAATEVGYRVTRLNTGHVATGTISTDLPSSSTLLAPQLWRNNGATAAAVNLAFMGLYMETDN